MNTLFRIYCEDVNRERMEEILSASLENFTIIPATGYYKGIKEKAVVIEVFDVYEQEIAHVSQMLANGLNQELVIYVEQPCLVGEVYGIQPAVCPEHGNIRACSLCERQGREAQ